MVFEAWITKEQTGTGKSISGTTIQLLNVEFSCFQLYDEDIISGKRKRIKWCKIVPIFVEVRNRLS